MRTFASREAFSADRLAVLDKAEAYLAPVVKEAIAQWGEDDWYAPALLRAGLLFNTEYEAEAGGQPTRHAHRLWLSVKRELTKALKLTKEPDKYTPDTIVRYIATGTVNAATEAAAADDDADLMLEWVSMHDKHVRPSHAKLDGQQRRLGEPFHVNGIEIRRPGDTSAPIEEWIGCRCVLRADVAHDEALVASIREELTVGEPTLWHGDDQAEHPGETVDETTEAAALVAAGGAAIPWHGVLTTEGHMSGDKRSFKPGALRTRNLPLPLTWQKVSDQGHRGSVKIARIDALTRVPVADGKNEIRAHGLMMPGDENADKVIGEMAFYGKIGVSVDVDDATFEVTDDNGQPSTEFTDARVSSACAVIIPAFQEAWLQLGEPPEGFMDGGTSTEEAAPEEAAAAEAAELVESFARGPGWVTNPDATKRIHDYWTVPGQPGYEKIAWGTEGDYERCITEIGQERSEKDPAGTARFIHAQCAQWQHDAIGVWPGKGEKLADEGTETMPTVSLVASVGRKYPLPKFSRFANPGFTEVTPPKLIEEDGVTYIVGHLAEWGQCHLDFPGICVTPPPLLDQGSNFMVGRVETDEGYIRAGCITLGGGHADINLGLVPAKAHYDDVTTAVADVCIGEDQFGLWMAGVVRPWATEEQRYQLLACDISGDWRDYGGEQALIAAHCVNSGGFRTKPRVKVVNGVQTALVAAGGLHREPVTLATEAGTGNRVDIASAVADGIRAYRESEAAAAKIKEVAEAAKATPADRLARVREQIGD